MSQIVFFYTRRNEISEEDIVKVSVAVRPSVRNFAQSITPNLFNGLTLYWEYKQMETRRCAVTKNHNFIYLSVWIISHYIISNKIFFRSISLNQLKGWTWNLKYKQIATRRSAVNMNHNSFGRSFWIISLYLIF